MTFTCLIFYYIRDKPLVDLWMTLSVQETFSLPIGLDGFLKPGGVITISFVETFLRPIGVDVANLGNEITLSFLG